MTAIISDHLPQFAMIPNMFHNISDNKSYIFERDWSKFYRKIFILDYFYVDWEDLLKIDELNTGNSTWLYLNRINMILSAYLLLKRINKYKLKFKSKPWITLGLQKPISVKSKLLINFINKKVPILNEELHTNYKNIEIYSLPLWRKVSRFIMIFWKKLDNIKNKEKGIKFIISLNTVASSIPTIISLENGDTITSRYYVNTFNIYFASKAETTKKV